MSKVKRIDLHARKAAEAHGNTTLWETASDDQRYWLERFTMSEILAMASALPAR